MKKAYRGKCLIMEHESAAAGIRELRIAAPAIAGAAAPGQFVNVYLPDGAMLLPRPLSIADARGAEIVLVYQASGRGTGLLSGIRAGGRLEVMGPLGTGFFDCPGSPLAKNPAEKRKDPFSVLLIGGGVGLPPLHFAAHRLRDMYRSGITIEAYLGFRKAPWYQFEIERFCDRAMYASESFSAGAFHGNVIDMLKESYAERPAADLALACGPRPMLSAAEGWCSARGIPLLVSLEERMGCGYGACAGCVAKTRPQYAEGRPQTGPEMPDAGGIVRKKVCADGPVFWADEVVW